MGEMALCAKLPVERDPLQQDRIATAIADTEPVHGLLEGETVHDCPVLDQEVIRDDRVARRVEIRDDVSTIAGAEPEDISSSPTGEHVIARPAEDRVVAATAMHLVDAIGADNGVCPSPGDDVLKTNCILCTAIRECDNGRRQIDRYIVSGIGEIECIDTRATIVAVAPEVPDHQVVASTTVVRVVAITAVEHIIAIATIKRVVAATAIEIVVALASIEQILAIPGDNQVVSAASVVVIIADATA